tara:strand:+ start:914 stop:1546 length:633 start_codon:yes stop_codon:yes gene_type:complete
MSRTYTETASGGKTFYKPFNAKFVHDVEKGAEGAVERENQNGKIVYEVHESGIIGMLKSGCIAKKEFGGKKVQELQLNLDEDAQLQIPMYLLKDVAEYLPNIDLSKEVKIGIYKNKRDRAVINVSQEEVVGSDKWSKLDTYYTKWVEDDTTKSGWRAENANGLPEVPYDEDEEEWDFKAQEKFLKSAVREFFSELEEANVPDELPEGAPF